jgi:hypothetical protein
MAIYRLLQTHAFEPELTDAMARAYEETLRRLRLADRTDPLTEIVAQRVVDFAQRDERDPTRLCKLVMQSLNEQAFGPPWRTVGYATWRRSDIITRPLFAR